MFSEASRVESVGDGRFAASFEDTWLQGRTVYGGLQVAVMVRAVEAVVADPARRVRSLTAHLMDPVLPGPVGIEARVVRAGGRVSHVEAALIQGGAARAKLLASCCVDRPAQVEVPARATVDLPPIGETQPRPRDARMPAFTQHLDHRWCLGDLPYAGGAVPELGGWCRFLSGGAPDAAMITALLDAWPPPVLPVLRGPRPASTIDVSCHLLEPDHVARQPPDTVWGFRARATHAAAGYVEWVGELWAPDGVVVARTRQWSVVMGVTA